MAVSLRRPIAFALVLICALAAPAVACLWDSDTLWQERAAFPSALELITGKFLRHSPEFYAWRVQDRLEKLKADPNNLALRDDLAVAYQKTGRSAEAIAVLEEKERIQPGVYETYSNLGTVYILQGDFEKGLPYIDKALAINPDAHFGREKYQKWLVEYALSRMTDGKLTFPLREFKTYNESRYPANEGFYDFLKVKWSESGDDRGDLSGAVKGVLGMMRFADHQNPLLLEALGDLLFPGEENRHSIREDARQLAARAYLQAADQVADESAQDAYRMLARQSLSMQVLPSIAHESDEHDKLAAVSQEFAEERANAEAWYAQLKQNELQWINDGGDVEVRFNQLYANEPTAISTQRPSLSFDGEISVPRTIALVAFIAAATFAVVLYFSYRRRAKLTSSSL